MKTFYILSYRLSSGQKIYRRGGLNTNKVEDAMKWATEKDAERFANQFGLNTWKIETVQVKDVRDVR